MWRGLTDQVSQLTREVFDEATGENGMPQSPITPRLQHDELEEPDAESEMAQRAKILQEQCTVLRRTLEEMDAQCESLKLDNKQLVERIEELTTALNAAEDANDSTSDRPETEEGETQQPASALSTPRSRSMASLGPVMLSKFTQTSEKPKEPVNVATQLTDEYSNTLKKISEARERSMVEACKALEKRLNRMEDRVAKYHLLERHTTASARASQRLKELEIQNREYALEIEDLRSTVTHSAEHNATHQKELEQESLRRIERIEELEKDLETAQVAAKRMEAESTKSRTLYEAKAEECESMSEALGNLQTVLEDFQQEREMERESHRTQLREQEEDFTQRMQSMEDVHKAKDTVETELKATKSLLEEAQAATTTAKAEKDKYASQCTQMRTIVEKTMAQMNQSKDEKVDRKLISQLLVTYFRRKQSVEVLEVMVRMLGMSNEDRALCGLDKPQRSGTGARRWLHRLWAGPDEEELHSPSSPLSPRGDNFADALVDFLLQAEEDAAAANSS